MTQIWVDADACPRAVKEVIYRAARRTQIVTTLVANQMLLTPPSPFIKAIQVPAGMDVADNEIVLRVSQQDLVITADIPLAAQIVEMGALALNLSACLSGVTGLVCIDDLPAGVLATVHLRRSR